MLIFCVLLTTHLASLKSDNMLPGIWTNNCFPSDWCLQSACHYIATRAIMVPLLVVS